MLTTINGATQIRDATIPAAKVDASIVTADGTHAFTGDQSLGGFKLTSLGTPTSANDAATKTYVDTLVNGLDWKASVRAATTANGTLATAFANGQTIDGVTLATGDRILLKNQTTGADNGIYTVNASGAPTRATDADASAEVTANMACFVSEGTVNADTQWALTTNDPITLGTTALAFAQIGGSTTYTGSGGVVVTGTVITVTYGTGSNTVCQGNDARLSDSRAPTGAAGGDLAGTYPNPTVNSTTFLKKADKVTRETPSGTVNGSNVTFTLANTPVSGTEEVFVNGILMDAGAGNDYTISTNTITFLTGAIPQTGDKVRVNYMK